MNAAKFVVSALIVATGMTFAQPAPAQPADAAAAAPMEPQPTPTPDAPPINSPSAEASVPAPVKLDPANVSSVPPSRDVTQGSRRPGYAALAEFEMFAHGLELRAGDARRSEAALSRAEVGLQIGFASNADRLGGQATAEAFGELRLEAIRSTTPQSGFGVDGDSLVLRVKRASWAASFALASVLCRLCDVGSALAGLRVAVEGMAAASYSGCAVTPQGSPHCASTASSHAPAAVLASA